MAPSITIDSQSPAGIGRRIGAYLIDSLLLATAALLLQAIAHFVGMNPLTNGVAAASGASVHLWVSASVTLPYLMYFTILFRRGATVGMTALRIRVASDDGERLPWVRSIVRSAVLLIPFEINHATLFHPEPLWNDPSATLPAATFIVYAVVALYVLVMLLTPERKSIHDLAAGSVVVRRRIT